MASPPPSPASPPPASGAHRRGVLAGKQVAQWRRTYLFLALLIALFLPLGWWLGWEAWAYWWLAAWSASMVLGALSLRLRQRAAAEVSGYLVAGFSGLCTTVLASMHGPHGAGFGLLLALPLGVMALVPSMPLAALLVGVGTLTGGIIQIVRFPPGREFAVIWVSLSVALTVIAVLGARGFRRVWVGELHAQREKQAALERLAESETRRAAGERLAVAGRLAAAVGHEINNPLAVVQAGVELLRDGGASAEEFPEVLDELHQAAQQIARKVAAMRALAQGTAAELEAVPAPGWIGDAWERAAGALEGLTRELPALEGLPPVQGLRPLLVQALEALLLNAAEAAREAPDPRRKVRLTAEVKDGRLEVAVEDGGHGLTPEVQARLFEPFFTTRGPSRSGLGLAVAREQVLRCGGTLEGSNHPGGGARFTLSLPLAAG